MKIINKATRTIFVFILGLVLGQFMISAVYAASLYESDSKEDKEARAKALRELKPSDLIVYSPKNPKGVVTVFTDLDCGYCRKLHSKIEQLKEMGIELRYLALPRQGIGSPGYTKMVSVWCSENRAEALTRAMNGEHVPDKICPNPIRDQVVLSRQWEVMGTPTIIFNDGSMWGGYMSPEKIAKEATKTQSQ